MLLTIPAARKSIHVNFFSFFLKGEKGDTVFLEVIFYSLSNFLSAKAFDPLIPLLPINSKVCGHMFDHNLSCIIRNMPFCSLFSWLFSVFSVSKFEVLVNWEFLGFVCVFNHCWCINWIYRCIVVWLQGLIVWWWIIYWINLLRGRGKHVGSFMPCVMLCRLCLWRLPDGSFWNRPAISSNCILRPFCTFTNRLMDSQRSSCASLRKNPL